MKTKLFLMLLASLSFHEVSASGCFSDEYESKINSGYQLLTEASYQIDSTNETLAEINESVLRNGASQIDTSRMNEALDLTGGILKNVVNSLNSYQRILNKGFKKNEKDTVCAARLNQTILALNELKSSLLVADIIAVDTTISNDSMKVAKGLQNLCQKLDSIRTQNAEFLNNVEKLKYYKENNNSVVQGSVAELIKLLNEPDYEVMVVLPGNKSIGVVGKEDFSKTAGRVAKSNNPSVWKVFVLTNKNLSNNQKNQLGLNGNEEVVVYDIGTGLTADRTHKAYNFSDLEDGFKILKAFAGVL